MLFAAVQLGTVGNRLVAKGFASTVEREIEMKATARDHPVENVIAVPRYRCLVGHLDANGGNRAHKSFAAYDWVAA